MQGQPRARPRLGALERRQGLPGAVPHGSAGGQGQGRYPSGNLYEGDFVDDRKQGYGIFYFANGSRYEGQWHMGEKHGQGTMYNADGSVNFKGEYRKGKPVR